METVTRARMKLGLIPDDLRDRMITTRTAVLAIHNYTLWPRSSAWLLQNYIGIDGAEFRVLGKRLSADQVSSNQPPLKFNIDVPSCYAFVNNSGVPVSGVLDGKPAETPVNLNSGSHEFRPNAQPDGVTVLWSRAVENGFRPDFVHLAKGQTD